MPDAIQPDVSTPQQEPTDNTLPGAQQAAPEVEPRLSRAEMMARLAESRKASLIADGYEPDAEPAETTDPDDTAGTDAAALDASNQVGKQQAEETILSDDQLANVKIRTKVNGVEQLVPLDQVRAGFQKTESADRYLAEAKQMLGEVKALRSQPAAPAQDAAATEPAPDQTSQDPDPIDAFTDALFQGDETRAKELLRRAVGRTAPNAGDIARQVEQQIVIRSALRQFAKDHRDIASDKFLAAKADEYIFQITEGQPIESLPPERVMEVFEEAGRMTKDWLRTKAGIAGEPSSATTRNERLARKTSIDNLPAASARATVVEPPPKTASTVIDAMRRARGQV